jgi:hypothetical protein
MDTTERYAWLHQCGHLVPGVDESFCPGCRFEVKPAQVEGRYILTPAEQDDDARQRIAAALRNLAPGHPAVRIGAVPEQAQEGNAWAADPEDLAELLLSLMKARP